MELPLSSYSDAYRDINPADYKLLTQNVPMPYAPDPSAGLLQSFQKAGEDFAAAREKQRTESQGLFKTMVDLGDYEGAKKHFIQGYLGDNFQQMTPEQEAQFKQNFEMTRRQKVTEKLETEVNLGTKFAAAPAATQVSLWPQVFPNTPMPTKTEIDAAGQPTTLSFEEAQKLLQGKSPAELQSLQQMGLISGPPVMGQSIQVRVSKKPDTDAMTKMTQTAQSAPRIKPSEIQAVTKSAVAKTLEGLINGLSSDQRAIPYVARLQSIRAGLDTMDPKQVAAATQQVISDISRSGLPFDLAKITRVAVESSNAAERVRHNSVMERIATNNTSIANARLRDAINNTQLRGKLAGSLIEYRDGMLKLNQSKKDLADRTFLALLKQRAVANGISLEKLNLLEKSIQGRDDGRLINFYLQYQNAKLRERGQNIQRDIALTPMPNDPLALDAAEQRAATLAEREVRLDDTFKDGILGEGPFNPEIFDALIKAGTQAYTSQSTGANKPQPTAAERARARAEEKQSTFTDTKPLPRPAELSNGGPPPPPAPPRGSGIQGTTSRPVETPVTPRQDTGGGQGPRVKLKRGGWQ